MSNHQSSHVQPNVPTAMCWDMRLDKPSQSVVEDIQIMDLNCKALQMDGLLFYFFVDAS